MFTSKKEVAESIGDVFGPFREEKGLFHIDYDVGYVYTNLDDLLIDWLPTIEAQHRENNGCPGCNWADEIAYIRAHCFPGRDLQTRISNAIETELTAIYDELAITSGDVTPEQYLTWEKHTEALAKLFAELIEQNKPL